MGISRKEALDCFKSNDLIGIGMEADAVRRRLHPENVVTYALHGTIDYTAPETNTPESICNKINEIATNGATGVTLQGQVHRSAKAWRPVEMEDRGLDRSTSSGAWIRHANHCNDDVWRRRDHRAPRKSPRGSEETTRGKRRLHGIYALEVGATKHVRNGI